MAILVRKVRQDRKESQDHQANKVLPANKGRWGRKMSRQGHRVRSGSKVLLAPRVRSALTAARARRATQVQQVPLVRKVRKARQAHKDFKGRMDFKARQAAANQEIKDRKVRKVHRVRKDCRAPLAQTQQSPALRGCKGSQARLDKRAIPEHTVQSARKAAKGKLVPRGHRGFRGRRAIRAIQARPDRKGRRECKVRSGQCRRLRAEPTRLSSVQRQDFGCRYG
jgi:hypothetical protein